MDKRIKDIGWLLSEYSKGNFDKRMVMSPALDEVDAIINGINMLGEELKVVTISRNYFTNIFNSVSDMVFTLDNRGTITLANISTENQLGYASGKLVGVPVHQLYLGPRVQSIRSKLAKSKLESFEAIFLRSDRGKIPVRIHASYFENAAISGILFTASDITFQIKAENLIIRAIIDTQEQERQRLAKDLHDSLTQQLSAIKFYISAASGISKNIEQNKILSKSNEALSDVIAEMRSICFNLMPKTLEEFGLVKAIKEFCNHLIGQQQITYEVIHNKLPELPAALKTDLYRVVQEFINNSITHGKATHIRLSLQYQKKFLKLEMRDNGNGFESTQVKMGMGLRNVASRVKSHDGILQIQSKVFKGTRALIHLPINTK